MEPKARVELATYALRMRCSTTELLGHAACGEQVSQEAIGFQACRSVFGGLYTTRGQGSHPDPWSLLEACIA